MNDAERENAREALKGATDEELKEHSNLDEARDELARRQALKGTKELWRCNKCGNTGELDGKSFWTGNAAKGTEAQCRKCKSTDIDEIETAEENAARIKLAQYDRLAGYLEKLQNEERYHPCGDLAGKITSMIDHFKQQRNTAITSNAALTEDIVVYLRALQLMIQNLRAGGTHRIKEYRADAIEEMIRSQVAKILEDRDSYIRYNPDWDSIWKDGYDFRKVLSENARLKNQVKELESKIEKLAADKDADGSG